MYNTFYKKTYIEFMKQITILVYFDVIVVDDKRFCQIYGSLFVKTSKFINSSMISIKMSIWPIN